MLRNLTLFALLMAVWILLSGHYTPLLLSLGVISCLIAVLVSNRMDVVDHEGHPFHLYPRLLTYIPWLTVQTVKSNIAVARIILSKDMPISPQLFKVQSTQKGDVGKTIFANSITLTPGTVSLTVDDDSILVHSISRESAKDLLTGKMDRKVTQLAGDD